MTLQMRDWEKINEGKEIGIKAIVKMCKEFGLTFIDAVERVVGEFELTREAAEAKVRKYWD